MRKNFSKVHWLYIKNITLFLVVISIVGGINLMLILDLPFSPKMIVLPSIFGVVLGALVTKTSLINKKYLAEKIKLNTTLKEKEVLLKEVHHRVKNNLQVVTSLLSLQGNMIENEEIKEIFKISQYRINSMAMIHEMLYLSEDLMTINCKEYIEHLTSSLINSFKGLNSGIKIENTLESIDLNIDTAIPLGLVINEILTNSLKYAFPDNKGVISIKLHKMTSSNLILEIGDNGVGFSDEIYLENSSSLGLKLISKLTLQLKGSIEKDTSKSGTNYVIKFQEIQQV